MPMKSRLCAMPVPPSTGYMSAWTNGSAPAAPNAKSAPTLAAQSSTKVTNTSTSSLSVPARTAPRHIMRSPTASSKEATRWSSTSAAPIRPATAPTPPATISPGERRRSHVGDRRPSPGEIVAGGVGAVAGLIGAADVDDHRVASFDDAVGDLMMWRGAVRAGTDNDEVDVFVTFVDDCAANVGADFAFGAAGAEPFVHALMYPVDGGTGIAQSRDFIGIFSHPQLPKQRAGQD